MKAQPNKILDIANRHSSVKMSIELTQQTADALDQIIKNLPQDGVLKVTKEHVVIAAVENYLEMLDKNKNKKSRKPRAKKEMSDADTEVEPQKDVVEKVQSSNAAINANSQESPKNEDIQDKWRKPERQNPNNYQGSLGLSGTNAGYGDTR